MPKITRNKFAANRQPGVRCENHIGKSGLRWNQMNLGIEIRESRMQLFPLLLRRGYIGAAGAVHPGINLVLDAVVIGRTEKQLAHRTGNLLANAGLSKIIGQLLQKRFHVRDQTYRLQGLMFDRSLYGGWIDIDTYRFHGGREHACHGERMLDGCQQHHMSYIGELLSHDFLSFNYIGRYPRNWSLIANCAGQYNINVVTDTGMHDAAGEEFLPHGRGNSAGLANGIDGTQMVLMSASRKGEIRIHSQRGSVQSPFHIIRGKRISGEKAIDIISFNESH